MHLDTKGQDVEKLVPVEFVQNVDVSETTGDGPESARVMSLINE